MTQAKRSHTTEHGWSAQARQAEQLRREAEAGRAVLTVASHSTDANECRELLEMLGLEPSLARSR
ncbi:MULTISPECIES: hypothetical protein [Thermocrispum]|jgi:hypothetical protein|uniref:Uncharacterized protein n=1 Tax=Thermocrispum agreste TaxID=37925 RepID=A0A2W4LH02_9PSEU|nr:MULTISPECIES: hypothetical protein [Thermocrispum]PZN00390.1 MAG: hypothetical protein DIU77_03795 [Thermocrispum agreste]